jgi:hypothetical protein
MVFMNAFYALAAAHPVHRTGGTAKNISAQQFFFNLIDGLPTPVTRRSLSDRTL